MAGTAPVVTKKQLLDAGEIDALTVFGAYVQGKSKPRFRISTTLDPDNPNISVSRRTMVVTDPDGKVETYRPTSWDFTIDTPVKAGTYAWEYSLTDSAGNTNAANENSQGTFKVLAYYAPQIYTLDATRYIEDVDDEGNPIYVENDEGTSAWIDVDVDIAPVAGRNAWELQLDYDKPDGSGMAGGILQLGDDGERITYTKDDLFPDVAFNVAYDYEFTLKIKDVFGEYTYRAVLPKGIVTFEISPFGIGDGGRCSGSRGNEKSDFHRLAEFHGGIVGVTNYSKSEVKTGGTWIDGKPIYRRVLTAEILELETFYTTDRIENVDTVIKVNSIFISSTGVGINGALYYSSTNITRSYFTLRGNVLYGNYWSNNYTGSAHMIVEYTKAGDDPVDPSAGWAALVDKNGDVFLTAKEETLTVKEE